MKLAVVVNHHSLVEENQKMGKEGNHQEVLEVAANKIHHLGVVVKIQSVFLVKLGKIQQNVQEEWGHFALLMVGVVVHFGVLEEGEVHHPFQEGEVRVHYVEN